MGQEVTPQMKARSSELEYEGVKLRRTVGYFSGINFLVGVIVGSGIFVSPGGVLKYSNFSVGIALVIWTICGLLSMIGALCYAELGCSLPVSGGEYQYIKRALGPVCAFIFLWTYVIFINPASIAAKALTFAEYAIQPFYPGCPIPELAKKGAAIAVVLALGVINSLSAKWATWVQNVFTVLKVLALAVISIGGIVFLAMGRTENMMNAFSGESPTVSQVGQAFYQGVFAFGGWNALNFITEKTELSQSVPQHLDVLFWLHQESLIAEVSEPVFLSNMKDIKARVLKVEGEVIERKKKKLLRDINDYKRMKFFLGSTNLERGMIIKC
ncbi:b(0,+)-type amino acid transporter 1-like [Protopterus annectens]|uniref:b(0,+)-type amino acid transporter 1-like n=1 Tax=Protopterus annectens TaxID=7888 RepID=UPI001CF952C6|nr:b(0,+)-type amino acid transporter 1-like [Protopterus annectens]